MKALDVIGRFTYREPEIPRVGKSDRRYPTVTLYGNVRLKSYFPLLQRHINAELELKAKKEHAIIVELIEDVQNPRLKLIVDGKKILMIQLGLGRD